MKATLNNGRNGYADHNDRNFDISKAPHIDPYRQKDNVYYSYKNIRTFAEAELQYYKDHYQEWLDTQNQKYLKRREKHRVKTICELLQGKQTHPEEIILQIGNKDEHPDRVTFQACVQDFVQSMAPYAANCHILDVAVHNDEATPHAHIRTVWDYTTEDGMRKISQREGMRQLGISLPDPDKEESRYNNRKMTFHKQLRDTWYDICEEHELDIDRIPDLTNTQHMQKNQVILRDQQLQIERQEQRLKELEQDIIAKQVALETLERELETQKMKQKRQQREMDDLTL